MIVSMLFVLLAVAAIIGAAGVLVCRKSSRCGLSFLLCCLAISGLFSLLDLRFVAIVQLVTGICVAGVFLTLHTPSRVATLRVSGALLYTSVGTVLLCLTAWGILSGSLGTPVLHALPMWAVPGEHLGALGRELIERYSVPVVLLAFLLLTGVLAAAYLLRQGGNRRREEPEG